MVRAIRWRRSLWAGVAACAASGQAIADPIMDRNFAIDFYEGVAIGDTSQVGMGGAGAARMVGSAGTLLNPAAPAVRHTTDIDRWSWDYHLDALTGRYSSDYDNNGVATAEASGAYLFTFGLSLRIGDWAGAITSTIQETPLGDSGLVAGANRYKVVVAKWIPEMDLSIGGGIQSVTLEISPGDDDPMFEITGAGLVAGATWVPRMKDYRAGAAAETAIVGGDVETSGCDPNDCRGYILPEKVASPGRLVVGGAYRWGPTPWNQLVIPKFRDERALTAALDVVVTGPTPSGHGLEAFGMRELQRSGRSTALSIRGGVEAEWLPGRLRLRAGSYWEPGRFDDVPGRVHVTLGADLRVLEFRFFGLRRGRLSGTADVASRYRNIALSIGFWH